MGNKDRYMKLSEIFKSIAHPDRLAIIQLLCKGGSSQRMTVKSIYNTLKLDQPIVSRHLSIMRNSGLLKREQEGNNIYYSICNDKETVSCITNCFKNIFFV